jgi:hypothetical protein
MTRSTPILTFPPREGEGINKTRKQENKKTRKQENKKTRKQENRSLSGFLVTTHFALAIPTRSRLLPVIRVSAKQTFVHSREACSVHVSRQEIFQNTINQAI